MKRFPEKRVLITGAGSGLGRALSIMFARMGWRVGIADIDKNTAGDTALTVKSEGGTPVVFPMDISNEQDFKNTADMIIKEWDGIDIIINNAGVPGCGYMEDVSMDKWEWIMDINLKGVIHGCRTFIPIMKKQGYGHIVNTASYLGFINTPESACYNMTKAGIISISETLRIELSMHNIGVSVLMPSFFVTNFMDNLYAAGERQQKLVTGLFEKSSFSAEKVAKCVLKAITKNRLYIIPQIDAKILWILKRWFPNFYFRLFQFIYKRGLVEKFFGIEL